MEQDENNIQKSGLPFFSVIVTTYNRAPLLKRALHSLTVQTERDWEAIVVDDGSSDDTEVQMNDYKNDGRIKYFKHEHKGATIAKNEAIHLSIGKYITFLDSDDEYEPEHLKTRKQLLADNKEVELLHGGVKIIGNQYVPDRFDYSKQVHLSECIIGGTFFIRRQLFYLLKEFKDIPMGSDAEFFERASRMSKAIMKTEIPTYIYHRESNDSITSSFIGKCE